MNVQSAEPITKCIGVVVVHGIGEQRRFEHLDGQVRQIVAALRARSSCRVTVEILSSAPAAFHAGQDSWQGGPSARVLVDDGLTASRVAIDFHEVWWADVNEPYSLGKQVRFWGWSLALWAYPDKKASNLPTARSVRPPQRVGGRPALDALWVRVRLFGVALIAVLGTASIGIAVFLAERILNLQAPKLVKVFVNYVAGVKIYNQKSRKGVGFPPKDDDFLDTIGEPPRVSIRRRMIRTLLNVASQNYERWYVLAHSQGTVIAFNGLMETAFAWPGYLAYPNALIRPGFLGPASIDWQPPSGETIPQRPVWASSDEVAYRSRVFHAFHGFLTLGSPLEKYAALWPARVPISEEPAFRPGTRWLNVYDPIDPVSGVLRSFTSSRPTCCPQVENIGYAAAPFLLYAHICYLAGANGKDTLADGVAEWLITGNADRIPAGTGPRWFAPGDSRHRRRGVIAWLSWIIVAMILLTAGALLFPVFWAAFTQSTAAILKSISVHVSVHAVGRP